MTDPGERPFAHLETQVDAAVAQLDRAQLIVRLCEKEGLAYASLTGEQLGPMLVTYQHEPIGELHTTSPSALQDWYAQPYAEDGSLGSSSGPYGTARAAAASLIRGQEEPGTPEAG
jgi:hypothetical protein